MTKTEWRHRATTNNISRITADKENLVVDDVGGSVDELVELRDWRQTSDLDANGAAIK